MERPKKIAIDCDDVLLDFNTGLATFSNENFGTSYCLEDVVNYNLSITWGIPGLQVIERISEFYNSQICTELNPIEDSVKAVWELREKYNLVVVTNRPTDLLPVTEASLNNHFKDLFEGVYCTNAFAKIYGEAELSASTKALMCQQLGAEVLIDDSYPNLDDCADLGIKPILFRRPWNKYLSDEKLISEGIYPANCWEEIIKICLGS